MAKPSNPLLVCGPHKLDNMDGLTLRDLFAAAALSGVFPLHGVSTDAFEEDFAKAAYQMADAMLRQRAEGDDAD
jgi:hypothetical protein